MANDNESNDRDNPKEEFNNERKNTTAHRNYRTLMKLAPEIVEGKYEYMRFQADEDFIQFTAVTSYDQCISMTHFNNQYGDMRRDTDMELVIDSKKHTVNVIFFTKLPDLYEKVGDGSPRQKQLNSLLSQWFRNIEQQGYKLEAFEPNTQPYNLNERSESMNQQTNDSDRTVAHDNYTALMKIMPEVIEGQYAMMRFQVNDAYMPLVIEQVMSNLYALRHIDTYKGGTILDPEMELIIDTDKRTVNAVSFTQYPDDKKIVADGQAGLPLKTELDNFLSGWIKNIEEQGYKPEIAVLPPDKDLTDLKVYFNADKKPFNIAYVHHSNQVEVYNRLDKDGENGMKKIAQINSERTVAFLSNDIPAAVSNIVKDKALITQSIVAPEKYTLPPFEPPLSSAEANEGIAKTNEPQEYKLEYHDIPVYGVEVYNRQKEQIANVLDNGRIEYMNDAIPQSACNEIEQFAANRANEREAEFFNMEGDAYGIYLFEPQTDDTRPIKENYRLAWFGKKEEYDTLDTIRFEFSGTEQTHYDFLPRENRMNFGSLDIIAMKEHGKVTAWLVQDYSFYRERDFFGKETPELGIKVMPDSSISLAERDSYGYRYDGILPLEQARALELFDADQVIYRLYPDDTEGMVLEREEIAQHDGLFGIEASDWLASREYAEMVKTLEHGAASQEAALIFGNDNAFGLYQLKRGDETRDYRFEPFDRLVSRGLEIERRNYELVYHAPLLDGETLDSLFMRFNVDRPVYFSGHSLSVSDVIVIQCDGELTSHYVDSIGFKELSAFLGNEHRIEHEDTYSYIDLLREHISNHFEAGYLTETQAQALYSNMDSLNEKMLAISSLYESGIPLDVETDTIDRLFHDELAELPEQAEPTPDKQAIPDTRPKDEKYSIMADLKAKIGAIAQESGTVKNAAKDSKKEVVGHG